MLGSFDDKNIATIAGLCLISGHTCWDDVAKFDFSPLILFLHHKVLQMKLTSFSDLLKPDTLQKIVEMRPFLQIIPEFFYLDNVWIIHCGS